jgi:hypothetical protein
MAYPEELLQNLSGRTEENYEISEASELESNLEHSRSGQPTIRPRQSTWYVACGTITTLWSISLVEKLAVAHLVDGFPEVRYCVQTSESLKVRNFLTEYLPKNSLSICQICVCLTGQSSRKLLLLVMTADLYIRYFQKFPSSLPRLVTICLP